MVSIPYQKNNGIIFLVEKKIITVPSRLISYFTYDSERENLLIVFVTGIKYNYKKIPINILYNEELLFKRDLF